MRLKIHKDIPFKHFSFYPTKKEHTTLCMFSFCMWSPILYFEVAIQSFELFRFHFFCNISIDVQCSWNIWMSECVLNDLYIYSGFTHSCCKCMSRTLWYQYHNEYLRSLNKKSKARFRKTSWWSSEQCLNKNFPYSLADSV